MMGKLLRVLVIIFLVLSVIALVFGCMLFAKRELLKGRTQKLETAIMQLGTTIEKEDSILETKPEYPAKDVSPCTAEILEEPERSTFWNTYNPQLEILDQPTFTLKDRQVELMTYYKIDPITQRIARDPVMRNKLTSGAGTMQNLLDELITRSGEQYDLLNATREQLATIRIELVNTITELNQKKREHRISLKKIAELEAEIARLNEKIRTLEENIAELETQIRNLEDKINDLQRDIAIKDETIGELEVQVQEFKKQIEMLTAKREDPNSGGHEQLKEHIEPGVKGIVVAANSEWNFVVMELSDKFISQLLGPEHDRELPQIDLLLKRGDNEQFVTKVRLRQIRHDDDLAVADILLNWQQTPPKEGDQVFF
ncbi:MAG: hypothetical protein JXN60_06930 [Lentisphaerae bacterium]|nr:hypothetical protein [Lentisphaerota bacterium]